MSGASNNSIDLSQFRQLFFEECAEQLSELESLLNSLERDGGGQNLEMLHAIFRTVHSVKGGAGTFDFSDLVNFAHVFETLLDDVRQGKVEITEIVVDTLIAAADVLADFVNAARDDVTLPDGFGAESVRALQALHGDGGARNAPPGDARASAADAAAPGGRTYRIIFVPSARLFHNANEPLLIIRELRQLGEASVRLDSERLPPLSEIDPEGSYLAWNIELVTEEGPEAIEALFEFVVDDCELTIEEVRREKSAESDAEHGDGVPPAGGASPAVTEGGSKPTRIGTIRVDLVRVDRLVNMIGELVISQSMLAQQVSELSVEQYPAMVRGVDELSVHMRELQESVMAIRMQAVKSVFARMPRLVRELSGKLGKKCRLVVTGETTEVDKTVIEQLADPLTHMIRNALDHGVEPPEEREANGKAPEATIHLSAAHRNGRIAIEIADDGRGIDRERVLGLARARKLISEQAEPSDEEIDNLIFLPGFSTADEVSDVSGRGVGMDVVRHNIENIGGRISVQSKPGEGCRILLALPLTLAILDGMIVAVGKEMFIIPMTSIIETTRPSDENLGKLTNETEVLSFRGEYVRLIHLDRLFGISGAIADPTEGLVILLDTEHGGKIGLVVDELLGQQQVVIKSLESNYQHVEGVSGVTILGNGMVALILDGASLEAMALSGDTLRDPISHQITATAEFH